MNKEDSIYIKQYLNGSDESLHFLVSKYIQPLYNFVYQYIKNSDDSEDIVQETFVKVWKHLDSFDQEKEFRPWLFQIAKNTIIDWTRKHKDISFSTIEKNARINIEEMINDANPTPFDITESNIQSESLNYALEQIPELHRNIVLMKEKEGITFREISERLNKPLHTVKSQYRRTLEKLKKIMM